MSNRIIIHNAVADDFKLEVFSSAPVDGSSGDYEDGRIIKYLTHFYAWHDASGEWKKFGNSTDITSLETRLSVQESSQAIAEASMVAIDSSLQTRISTEESASTSAVDSAEVRAAAAEGVISGNLSSELVDRAADVSAEASRAASAEVILSTNLSSGIVAREADVSVEKARAEAAEGSLQTRLAAEESNELSAETSLNLRASTEESTRLAADNSLAAAISSEASLAREEETSLESRLSSEEDRVDAILAASTADKNTFVETVSFINAIDVAHDAQTSTQISSVDSAIASAESSRIASDSSLQTRLSSEESTEASAEVSLNTRMTAEASNELSAEGSLDIRSSSEESLRLAEDTSLETVLSGAGSSRASGDSSLTTAASVEASTARSAEVSVQSSLSAAALARGNADNSLETRLSVEESAMIVAVDSIEALRSAGDLSLTTRVSSEEIARAAADSSLTTRVGVAESARSTADTSLETRLAAEESSELSAETSLDTRVSSEASAQVLADGSLQTRFSGELSVERSKLDDILDSAAADKDTFVEIVSFITSVDTDSDDALASYVVAVDADISTEVSTARSSEAVLSTNLSSEVSAMGSAVAATYATISGNIATHATAIDTKEQHEGVGRHVRIDFTNQTTFSVAAVDLPTNFEPGNGMAQIFQEVSSGVYRHLVAPSTYNATTGVMSFDLGVSQKSGFAVFYSFAGDEAEATEVQAFSDFTITDATMSMGAADGDASSLTISVSGMSASNYDSFLNLSGNNFYMSTSGTSGYLNYSQAYNGTGGVSFSWNSDYSVLTIEWDNNKTPTTSSTGLSSPTTGYYAQLKLGGSGTNAYVDINMWFDPSTGDLIPKAYSLGEALDNGDTAYLSPPYMSGTGTAGYSSSVSNGSYIYRTSRSRSLTGPQITIPLNNVFASTQVGILRNFGHPTGSYSSSVGSISNETKNIFGASGTTTNSGYWAIQHTYSGTDYYAESNIGSTHHLYSEVTTSRTQSSYIDRMSAVVNSSTDELEIGWFRNTSSGSAAMAPDSNSTLTIYFAAPGGTNGSFLIGDSHYTGSSASYNWSGNTSYATDIKIVVDMSDQSYDIYRNSNVGGSPTWVAVERAYLSNQDV